MLMGMRAWLLVMAAAGSATAAPGAFIGQLQPAGDPLAPCTDCTGLSPIQKPSNLVVLPPKDVAPPGGVVTLVQPLIGFVAHATVDQGRAALPVFLLDRREGDNGVLVLPGAPVVHIVAATPADIQQIKAALLKNEVLSHIGKAVAKLEVGAVALDGSKQADFAVTYGCAAWGDGSCQLRGQFLLERRGGKWVELE